MKPINPPIIAGIIQLKPKLEKGSLWIKFIFTPKLSITVSKLTKSVEYATPLKISILVNIFLK